MYRYLRQMLNSYASRATMQGSSLDAPDRQIVVLGVLLTTIVLAYFYAADNYYFSTRYMSPIFQ
jgi:hypothetical protein